jgi:hypothetical protein
MAGLPAYFLGKQGGKDAMFLPEIHNQQFYQRMLDFK